MLKKSYKILLITSFFTASFLLIGCLKVSAQLPTPASQCGGDDPATALISAPLGSYDIYVKLGQINTQDKAQLYTQELSIDTPKPCNKIGESVVDGSAYTKVANSVALTSMLTTLSLAAPSVSSLQTAAAPQVILVNTGNSPCQLSSECVVTYQGVPMQLSPKKLSLSSDSLRVGILLPVNDQDVKSVVYAVDGKPVYQKSTLQPFDERYVSGGTHTISRRVIFASGQSLVDTKTIEKGTSADLQYTAIAYYMAQSNTIKIILLVTGIFALLVIVKSIVRLIFRRRLWKQQHIASAGVYKQDKSKVGAQKNFYNQTVGQMLYRYRRWIVGFIGVIVAIIVISTYVVGYFTVDGVSMYPTLQDKSVHPLVKLPKSIATINRSQYVPKLGDIVVVIKDENNLFDPSTTATKSYVVKRVLGLPGERITLKNGNILVYNDQNLDGFEPDVKYNWVADLAGSELFNIDITLKDSELFVVGDNRDESIDSRFYGPIDTKEVIGKVIN